MKLNYEELMKLLLKQNKQLNKNLLLLAQLITPDVELNIGLHDAMQAISDQIDMNSEFVRLFKLEYINEKSACIEKLIEEIGQLKETLDLNQYFYVDHQDIFEYNSDDVYKSRIEKKEDELEMLLWSVNNFNVIYDTMIEEYFSLLFEDSVEYESLDSEEESCSSSSESDSCSSDDERREEEVIIPEYLFGKENDEDVDLIIPKGFFWQDQDARGQVDAAPSVWARSL